MLRGLASTSKIRRDLARVSAITVISMVRSNISLTPSIVRFSGRSKRITESRMSRRLPRKSNPTCQAMPAPGSRDGSSLRTCAPLLTSIRSARGKSLMAANRSSAGNSLS